MTFLQYKVKENCKKNDLGKMDSMMDCHTLLALFAE